MDELPPDFESELGRMLGVLADDLRLPQFRVAVIRGAVAATMTGQTLLVPSGFVDHWRRFKVMPSALVRDAAYQAKRTQLRRDGGLSSTQVEADAMAYSEKFLKIATSDLPDDD